MTATTHALSEEACSDEAFSNEALSNNGSQLLLDGILVYLTVLNRKTTRDDMLFGLPAFQGDIPLPLMSRALSRLGLVSQVVESDKVSEDALPALIKLDSGRFVVLLRREQSEYVLTDDIVSGGEYRMSETALGEQYAGVTIVARPDIAEIQKRHTGQVYQSHWFWGRFLHQKKLVFDIILSSLFANLLAVSVSLFALQVYDRVIPNQSTTTLWVLAVGCFVAIALEALLRVSRSYLMDVSGKLIELELSSFLFRQLSGMRLSKRPASPGSLVSMMREFSSVREFFTATSVGSVADIPFVFIFLLLIYAIAGPVVWIVLLAMVLIITPSLLSQNKMSRLSEESLGGASAAGKLLTQMTYGQETVKAVRAERLFQQQWEEINTLSATKTTEQRTLAASLSYWSASIQQTAYIIAVIVGVYMIFAGEFTVGTIIAVSILTTRTLSPITQLSGAVARWQQVKCALEGLAQIAESSQERSPARTYVRKPVLHGDISLRKVSFCYQEDEPASLGIGQLDINSADIIAVLGENGSGKSTLLKVLSGIYDFNDGTYTLDGLDVRQLDPEDLRKNIAYLPQESKTFSGTLRDNLTLGQFEATEDQLFEALRFSGLDHVIRKHPLGLDLPIMDGGDGISVGQRQSLSLSRLYLQDPRIVLLDEPTASLDQNLEAKLVSNLQDWLTDRTCVVATHRVPILSIAKRIVVMKEGQIAMDDSREKVMETLMGNRVPVGKF